VGRTYPPTIYNVSVQLRLGTERALWLFMARADRYQEGLSQDSSGYSIMVKALSMALTISGVHNGPSSGLSAWHY
jgi:hypothetical protein